MHSRKSYASSVSPLHYETYQCVKVFFPADLESYSRVQFFTFPKMFPTFSSL